MKKIGTYLLAAALLLSLAACAPKRYERKHSPVGASSVKKSHNLLTRPIKNQKKASQMKRMRKLLEPCQKQTKRISIQSLKTVRL